MNYLKKIIFYLCAGVLIASDQSPTQSQMNQLMEQAMQHIWQEAMVAKHSIGETIPRVREELLSNLCSSAPTSYFVTHADLSDSLTGASNTSASVFVSTDNQGSWIQNSDVNLIGSAGYETTWGATTAVNFSNDISWYLSGSLDSESLGLDFGQVTVSQSPFNETNIWPPSDNLYASVAIDVTGETGSGQDITNIRATYSNDKLFASLGLNGSCCDEGGFFGPWNLYAIAIVNPDAANPVAYAYAYGDGGLGQLYPAIYKIDGDLTTGEIGGFEALSENFDYSTAGNQMQASSMLSIITNDADWGEWPNSFNGVGLIGVTVSAGLDGLAIATELLDTSDVGVLVLSTQTQNGNTAPSLSNPTYENGVLSVTYTDFDNNLATNSDVFIEDMGFVMIPDGHTYSEGVVFSADVGSMPGIANFFFSDGANSIQLDFDFGGGSGGCQLSGDVNEDGGINVLDIVLTTNLILCTDCPDSYNECADLNSDNYLNVLDVVLMVNLILGN
tara:strand:+ start:1071 stop:2576 length:1506 start_codon:yes stop_codon:yes gene_type:complete